MKSLGRTHDKAELVARLGRLTPRSERRWGRMNVHQMVCHLADNCRMALGQKAVSPDTSIVKRTLIKWVALYAPLQWRPGILTRPEIDQQIAGTCPTDFGSDVAEVKTLLDTIADHDVRRRWPDHPVFGRMSSSQWLRWAYLHTDHHLRQFGA
jgi:uncharacterized protein DUF1569